MEQVELEKSDPRIAQYVKGYKGRKSVKVRSVKSYNVMDYWSDGSREYARFVNLNTGMDLLPEQAGFVMQEHSNPFRQMMGEVILKPGIAVVVNSIFCGKNMGYRLYVCESDFARFA
jgi:hypothetical protein